ncbi:MAG TPA: hypothetical protein PK079_25410, partial [Leptospiraceae bacterium]|nr:hypothetical protein [Leptospiraceae bacterium]
CFIISKEDLIIQKVLWSRESFSEMQFRDVRNLTRLDYNKLYVEEWIKKLNLEETWNKIYV